MKQHITKKGFKSVKLFVVVLSPLFSAAPLQSKATERSTVGKEIWQPIDGKNVGSDVSIRPSVHSFEKEVSLKA